MAGGERNFARARQIIPGCDLIIDSGAFTYFKKGGISLDKWISTAKRVKEAGGELIALDVIGDPSRTLTNYTAINAEIKGTVPTFHVGSDLRYLDTYLAMTDRIAIGGMVPYKTEIPALCSLLDKIFSYIGKTCSTTPRLHAFGMFNQVVLERYPFYSADATTWQNASRFGEIQRMEGGKFTRHKSLRVGGSSALAGCNAKDIGTYIKGCSKERLQKCIATFLQFENHITALWAKRGITWTA